MAKMGYKNAILKLVWFVACGIQAYHLNIYDCLRMGLNFHGPYSQFQVLRQTVQ